MIQKIYMEAMAFQKEHVYNCSLNKDNLQNGVAWESGSGLGFDGKTWWLDNNNNYEIINGANHWHKIMIQGDQNDGQQLIEVNIDGVHHPYPSQPEVAADAVVEVAEAVSGGGSGGGGGGRRRRRKRKRRDEEVVEKQRMIHIAVERNRRKQMNYFLAQLRSLMPPSYSQRGDQASIVGGAINMVKELEQHLQYLQAQHPNNKKKRRSSIESNATQIDHQCVDDDEIDDHNFVFSDFFTHPQYSRRAADVEVRAVEKIANVKLRCRRQPKQLLKILTGLAGLRLTVLHLHVTTFDQTVLYSFNVKVEEGCKLSSADEIATAVHDLIASIRNQAVFD